MAQGSFEVCLPCNVPSLAGKISADIYEVGGCEPTNIIKIGQAWGVKIRWSLEGGLVPFICGKWCVNLFLESMGDGPEITLPKRGHGTEIEFEGCKTSEFCYDFKVEPGLITTEHCTIPYKVVASVTYETTCGQPGPMAGFVEGALVTFYEGK